MLRFKLKLKYRHITSLEIKRLSSSFDSNCHVLQYYFGLHQNNARAYIVDESLGEIPTESLMKTINFCEDVGYTKKEILKNPMLLRMQATTLDQYYKVMTEGGFIRITPQVLSKFRTLNRRSITELKQKRYMPPDINVIDSFIKYLKPCPDDFYVKGYDESECWANAHYRVLITYLKWRLNSSDEAILKALKIHPTICRKSFEYLCQTISIIEDLGFGHEKILKNGYLLHTHPKTLKEILENYPAIAGVSIKKAIKMYPKIATIVPSNIPKIKRILVEHGISRNAIAKRLDIFQLSPETIDYRLKELKKEADFKALMHNPNVLKLVIHHNRAKSRLAFLRELQLKCATLSLLGNPSSKFDFQIREGKDVNSHFDTFSFLKGIFKTDDRSFENTLKRHPYYLQVPLRVMEQTYHFLLRKNFTNDAILKVIYILLYPKEKIESALQHVKDYEEKNQKILSHVKKLNLVLYLIEKEHHFTGDGVWTKHETIDESVTL